MHRDQEWILDEKTSLEHIKYAYDHGINTFEWVQLHSVFMCEADPGDAVLPTRTYSIRLLGHLELQERS